MNGVVDSTNKYYCTANGWVSLTDGWSWDVPKEVRLNPDIEYGTMTDTRDGQTYKTVVIGDQTWMVQVAMTMMNSADTEDRENKLLEAIRDNYPKYVLTRNDMIRQRNGIKHANIGPFMKDGKLF